MLRHLRIAFLLVLLGSTHVHAYHARAALLPQQINSRVGTGASAAAGPVMSARRAHLGGLAAAGLAAVSTNAVSAAEPRSTPWAYSTFLEAIETNQVEKVSFSADGKQVLSIDRDGNRCALLRLC